MSGHDERAPERAAAAPLRPPRARLESGRFVLRAWEPGDAPRLASAVRESREHLMAWTPWVVERFDLELPALEAFLDGYRAAFREGREFLYAILDASERELLGGIGLYPRVGPGALEIGYWLHVAATGRGIATEATALLTREAIEVCGASRVEIRCDERHERSAAIPRRLGYHLAAMIPIEPAPADGRSSQLQVWVLDAPGAGARLSAIGHRPSA